MKKIIYLLIAICLVACGGQSMKDTYSKTITDNLLKGKSNDLNLKIVELTENGSITVADSIAYLTDEFRKDKELIVKRIELARETTKELQAKSMTKHNHKKYMSDIATMDNRIDSLRNLVPDNLRGYDKRNSTEVLAKIIRCKYSVQIAGTPAEETFDFYLSPDGSKCYGKKKS